ncbi:hypothetical protein [Dactylosporangium aurantiacum]|uniref:hypothetical protein n=1 Tax=Dactylosporangium aurantiacum TaxID=35754 RepID=UPI0005269DCC|nr:hypothetical protein [Dactylosporangium aurantiacum]MDG6100502.1 hypothetical protein [Dactylosporangium aurantiacum]
MRIGYSMWGFLGDGVLDTPDGSRSYRSALIDELMSAGHDVVFLQRNRDLLDAGDDLRGRYRWDDELPDLDVLMVEWRWRLRGRNDTPCGSTGHTCDLHRQHELLEHYTRDRTLPTLIWDLDRQLAERDALRSWPNVTVADFALQQRPGVLALPCPVPDALLDTADPVALAAAARPTSLVYVGNQYDRDPAFAKYFAPAAARVSHEVAGKWPRTGAWPHVTFTGRCAYPDVAGKHRRSLTTVLLMPDRYAAVAAMGSRWFESVTAGCLPLAPAELALAEVFVPAELRVVSAADVLDRIAWLRGIQGSPEHADLIRACLACLEPFRTSRQVAYLTQVLRTMTNPPARDPAAASATTPNRS